MQMQEWGEDNFIKWLKENFSSPHGSYGIGDDCAVIPYDNKAWLVTTDALTEGIHFLRDKIPAFQLGYKTVMVNLSDIAAMGGTPKFCLLSIAMPSTTESYWVQGLMEGIKEACTSTGVSLLGGDTTDSTASLFLNIVAIGESELDKVKYRHTAKPGDILCVTGFLGDSGAGLGAIIGGMPLNFNVNYLINAHLAPKAHLEEGLWLGNQLQVSAMMDLSDGIEQDLSRLLQASQCGADVSLEFLPISQALQDVAKVYDWDIYELALTGGEDYCLMLTVSPDEFPRIAQHYNEHFKKKLFQIGKLTNLHSGITYYKNGSPQKVLKNRGFNHFSNTL